jgi:predicted N-formylglutamate amidohydrolase
MSLMDPENCFEIMAGGNLGLLRLCDHASNPLPPRYDRLGLAAKLDCPAVLSRYSRLPTHKSGVDEWAGRLARVIEPIMNDPAIHRIEHH